MDEQLSLFDSPLLNGGPLPDFNNPFTIFLKGGKPSYLSKCPKYEGYWLDGGFGAVQCDGAIFPGHQWYTVCSKCPEDCQFR